MTRLALIATCAALLAASFPADSYAQRGTGGAGRGGNGGHGAAPVFHPGPPPTQTPVLGDIGAINRPLGADINGIQTTPPPGFGRQFPSPFTARRGTYTRLQPFPQFGYGYGYGYAPFYDDQESTYEKLYRVPEVPITTGTLFLDVTPANASVFVDSAYVGDVSDLRTRGVMLPAGRHTLELEATGYDRKTIDVVLNAAEPLRYRYDMTAAQRAAIPLLPPPPPQTMYVIPGCYGGNRPPARASLPQGCDIAKLQVRRPQTRTN